MKESMKHMTLNEAERAYQNGIVSEADLEEYLKAWNDTTGRFTVATLSCGGVRMKDKH